MHFDSAARQSYRQAVTVMNLEELAASTPPGTPWLGLDLGEKTIGDRTRRVIVGWPIAADGSAPAEVTVTPAQ